MHVLVITPSLWPLHHGPLARAVADYVDACKGAGARVSVLTTASGSTGGLLARRLDPLAIPNPTGSTEVSVHDGQTPSASARVWAPESDDWGRLGPVGTKLARQLAPIDVVHAFDDAAPALLGIRTHATVATLTGLPTSIGDSWATAVESATAVVVPSARFAAHPSSGWRSILAGARRVVGISHGARLHPGTADASAARAQLGLPARYPIAVTHGPVDLRVTGSVDGILELGLSWVAVLGAGSPSRVAMKALAEIRPRRVLVVPPDDPRALAARSIADLHVFGAPYEPSPASPLGRAGGGISVCHSSGDFADRIVHWDPRSRTGNGFRYSDGELGATLEQACAALAADGPELRRRAVHLDLSWARSARAYLDLYREVSAPFAKNWPR